jgi:hypothetical protein
MANCFQVRPSTLVIGLAISSLLTTGQRVQHFIQVPKLLYRLFEGCYERWKEGLWVETMV